METEDAAELEKKIEAVRLFVVVAGLKQATQCDLHQPLRTPNAKLQWGRESGKGQQTGQTETTGSGECKPACQGS